MEELYRSVIPDGTIHCLDWSILNLLAVSVSVRRKECLGEGFGSSQTHQLCVVDINRPWEYNCVYGDSKTPTKECKWSPNGRRILSVEQDGVARVWRMKDKCINSWQRAHKIELDDKLLHAGWMEYEPLPNIDFNKTVWSKRYECPSHSSHINIVCPEAVIFVYSTGKLHLVSFHDNDSISYEVCLDVEGSLYAAKTMAATNGSILCVVCCADGHIKLFTLNLEPTNDHKFCITATLATSFHPTNGGGGQLTDLVMHPHTGGCSLHICYDSTNLLQWSLTDTSQGNYLAKRESLEIMSQPITSICCTSLCLYIADSGPESIVSTPAGAGDFMLDVEREDKKRWPIELIVMGHQDGSTTVLNRNTYQVLYSGKVLIESDSTLQSVNKRPRFDSDKVHQSSLSLCISPNGCCVAFTFNDDTITIYSLCPFVLGEKEFSTPEVCRWSVLLALSAIKGQSVWDIVVTCSRVAYHSKDQGLIKKVLSQWSEEYVSHANHMTDLLIYQYHMICSMLYCCLEDGLLASLDQRDFSRLHGICSLMFLSVPTFSNQEIPPIQLIKDCCASDEDNIENVVKPLVMKDYCISQDVSSQLQSHAHWIIEISIRYISRILSNQTDKIPDVRIMRLLQESILLIYIWNQCLQHPVVNIHDAALTLLYKAITTYIRSPDKSFDESFQSEVSKNIPQETESNLLTLTKASNLQGFIHGLSTTDDLPEIFHRGRFPRLRPHVQTHYPASDPYSPLGLVVPKDLVPPWRDVFVDGHYDIIRGSVLIKSVLQDTRLLQCSSCRSWTLPYSSTSSEDTAGSSSNPVEQWQYTWSSHCMCGGSWTIH